MNKTKQKFDLLESLRDAAQKGCAWVEETLAQGFEEKFVKKEELEELIILLRKAERAHTIEEMRQLINEDSIPVELIITEKFWGDFQELIYKLSSRRNR